MHAVQVVLASVEYLPATHASHDVRSELATLPAAHAVQVAAPLYVDT